MVQERKLSEALLCSFERELEDEGNVRDAGATLPSGVRSKARRVMVLGRSLSSGGKRPARARVAAAPGALMPGASQAD